MKKDPPNWWSHDQKPWTILQNYFCHETILRADAWKKLSQGFSNHNYCLTLDKICYFVQIVNMDNVKLLPSENSYPDFQQLAEFNSLKPWLAKCLTNTSSVRIFEWIDGETIHQGIVNSKDYQRSILDFLSIIHNQSRSKSQSQTPAKTHHQAKIASVHLLGEESTDKLTNKELASLDLKIHLQNYHALASKRASNRHPYDAKLLQTIDQTFDQALRLSLNFSPTTLCHNDLSPQNQLWNSKYRKLTVIDWEYASYSDPCFELAIYCHYLNLELHEEMHFLQQYQDRVKLKIDPTQYQNMKKLVRLINQLWHFAAK